VVRSGAINALAHITGGGLLENIPRVLPDGLHALVGADAWPQPRLMAFLQGQGNIEPGEFARTFNCGIGMAILVSPQRAAEVRAGLERAGETVFEIGRVEAGAKGCTVSGSAGAWSGRSDWTATHHG
jgi:phosphoribosylformylglycinamidine cyclo-ligase